MCELTLGLAMRRFLLMRIRWASMRMNRITNKKQIALAHVVILRCVLPQWDLRFPSYKCLKKDIFTRYILTPTKFNCTMEHAQILKQIPKKSHNSFFSWIIIMKYLIQKQDLIQTLLRYLDQINCSSP